MGGLGLGTGIWALDWAILAGSLMNTILLLWLGLTVLLNAERRTWGTWIGGGALLLGAAFFLSHSAILGRGLDNADWAAALDAFCPARLAVFLADRVVIDVAHHVDNFAGDFLGRRVCALLVLVGNR